MDGIPLKFFPHTIYIRKQNPIIYYNSSQTLIPNSSWNYFDFVQTSLTFHPRYNHFMHTILVLVPTDVILDSRITVVDSHSELVVSHIKCTSEKSLVMNCHPFFPLRPFLTILVDLEHVL